MADLPYTDATVDEAPKIWKALQALDAVDARIIHRVARLETTLDRRVAALEALTSDQADALERQSRDIEELRAAMGNAQVAIRGLGQEQRADDHTPDDY